ncbi:MAG: hypothetical protein ACO37W_10595 [Prochlorotrichaceae cyanobacterium]
MRFPLRKDSLLRVFSVLCASGLAIVLSLGLSSCAASDANVLVDLVSLAGQEQPKELVHLQEVATPSLIQTLHSELDRYQPQVKITAPTAGEVIQQTTVNVNFEVEDYPLFKNPDFGMGPHLHVFLDDQPYTAVYSTSEPLVLTDLSPGTHTLRAFASRPWHESFKNEGAYAQVTFHVLTETGSNAPDPTQPLLTYSRPQSSYGAEPIMLDFYLTNAPLHFLASSDPEDEIPDWRIRATINDESFLIDRWEPIYLTGFAEGANWVKLEFLGSEGEPIPNVFNTTARLIDYTPNGNDGLARIVRGEVSLSEALAIVQSPSAEITEAAESPEEPMPAEAAVEPEAQPVDTPEAPPISDANPDSTAESGEPSEAAAEGAAVLPESAEAGEFQATETAPVEAAPVEPEGEPIEPSGTEESV